MDEWTPAKFRLFWRRMGELYGRAWYAKHGSGLAMDGTITNKEWYEMITGLTVEQTKKALDKCRAANETAPPSALTFRARAKLPSLTGYDRPKPRPRTESQKREAKTAVEKMKEILINAKTKTPNYSGALYRDE